MQIGQRLIEGSLLCGDESAGAASAAGSEINGCLVNDPALAWAFASEQEIHAEGADRLQVNDRKKGEASRTMPPHDLASGGFTFPLGTFFPGRGKLSPPSADAWSLDPGDLVNDEEAFVSASVLDSRSESTPFAYRYSMSRTTALTAGVGWIYDIADTTGMAEAFAQTGYDTTTMVGAVNVTLGASYNAFTLTGGYLHAIDSKEGEADLMAHAQNAEPTAWNSELAYMTEFLDRQATLAVGYLKSSEALSHYLPEERYSTRASIFLHDNTILSLEYYQDKEYSSHNDLGDDDAYGITTKLGFQF